MKRKVEIKTKETYTKDELKRYLGSLAEDFTNKVKVLGEGLKIVMEKQNLHTEMIGNIMEDVSVVKDDMQIVKKEIKKKVDYDEFISLVQRVSKLEAKN